MPSLMDKITKAQLVSRAESGSDEWHAARLQGIGGSDIGTIAGLSKWNTPTDLWAIKTGRSEGPETSPAMEWGTRLEPVIREKFEELHPEFQVDGWPGSWKNSERPWQLANPDGLCLDDNGMITLLEIKTAKWPSYWKEGVPLNYQAQVQWYMSCLGIDQAIVAVLFHGSDYQEFTIPANPLAQEVYIEQALEFLEYVYTDTPPDIDQVNG